MKVFKWLLLLAIASVTTHLAIIFFTPSLMMGLVNLNAQFNNQYGELLIRPRSEAGADAVVRTSPDLLYSACVFHLDKGAYRITAPPMDSYMSLSIFAHNTDNFYQNRSNIEYVFARPNNYLLCKFPVRI